MPDHCFEEVTINAITHLLMTERGYDAILMFVCCLSKYAYYIPCKSAMTAEEFADIFLRVIIACHGIPKKIISDRDSRFTSKFWRALVARMGCDHAMSLAYHPQTNG